MFKKNCWYISSVEGVVLKPFESIPADSALKQLFI